MKAFVAALLAVFVLLASTAGLADAYWHDGRAVAAGNVAVGEQCSAPCDRHSQQSNHHGDHLAHHFVAQLPSDLSLTVTAPSADFVPLSARPPLLIFDTPTRPPRSRLS
jgi:hypothetical protein